MLAGDFVRRAVGNVTNTISHASSSVTSAAQGKKRHDISADAVEKCSLTVKCTPHKDAVTTTALSIKHGYLMKRNEQGQWIKRYVCTVPHMFLYYFDSDSAESPRGVIDLELYTNITQDKNTLKVSTVHEEKMRSFHFMSDDEETLNNWLAHLLRDRYFGVCEERSAYHQMQSELAALLDTMNSQMKDIKAEKDVVEKQLQDALLDKQESMKVLQNLLVNMGITEEAMSQLQDLPRAGKCLQESIARLQNELRMNSAHAEQALEAEKTAHREELSALHEKFSEEMSELHEKLAEESRVRANLETLLAQQKKTCDMQVVEYKSYMDAHFLGLQSMAAAKQEVDEKNATLTDQRKLLVKEVKRTRARLAETESSIEQIGVVNDKLTAMVIALQAEMKAVKAHCDESLLGPPFVLPGDIEQLLQESHDIVSKSQSSHNNEAGDRPRGASSAGPDSPPTESPPAGDGRKSNPKGGTRASVSGPASSPVAAAGTAASSTFSMFSNTFSRFSGSRHSITAQPASAPASAAPASTVTATTHSKGLPKADSFTMASSATEENTEMEVSPSGHKSVGNTDPHSPHKDSIHEGHASERSPNQLHCLRCGGTVEGPQFSTCKCANPALAREDLATENSPTGKSSWGFGSLLSKSSQALAGGLHKLTAKDPTGDTHSNSHNNTNSTHGHTSSEAIKESDKTGGAKDAREVSSDIISSQDSPVVASEETAQCQGDVATAVDNRSAVDENALVARAELSLKCEPTADTEANTAEDTTVQEISTLAAKEQG